MLKAESLSFSYDTSHIFTFPEIVLNKGEDLLILGDSGVGKTTLIQILSGLLRPKSGFVELNGTCLQDLSLKSPGILLSLFNSGDSKQNHIVRLKDQEGSLNLKYIFKSLFGYTGFAAYFS